MGVKQYSLITTEFEALRRTCMPLKIASEGRESMLCLGSECFTYWRWFDDKHDVGYCSYNGIPEIP
jgi:hypothetical protein